MQIDYEKLATIATDIRRKGMLLRSNFAVRAVKALTFVGAFYINH